jgi:hypothetical protein
MYCGLDYPYILLRVITLLGVGRSWIGDDGLALLVLALSAIGLTLLFEWSLVRLTNYVRNNLSVRARNLFFNSWLSLLGFRLQTCVASVLLASAVYILLKAAARFPGIWHVWLIAFGVVLVAFTIAGWLLSGRIKPKGFVKHYYVPALCGVLFFAFNILLDITINLVGALVTLVSA